YIGNIVYNRQSSKLGGRKLDNPVNLWVRGEQCIEPIIDRETFDRVSKLIENRRVQIPEDQMLPALRRLLHKKGRLTGSIINSASGMPGYATYVEHFGGLLNAYRLIGYTPAKKNSFVELTQLWGASISELVSQIAFNLEKSGKRAQIGEARDELLITGK